MGQAYSPASGGLGLFSGGPFGTRRPRFGIFSDHDPLRQMQTITQFPPKLANTAALSPAQRNGVHICPAPNSVNILMVDDRDDKLLALESVLSCLGQNLVRARTGKEALRHLLKMEFAVILMDVSMPGMDGFE